MPSQHRTASLLLVVVATLATTAQAEEHDHRQHDAHEHGAGTLNIALEGNTLMIELESPAMNIVGFEHPPRDEKQHQAIDQAATTLRQGDKLFTTPSAAGCVLKQAQVESSLLEEGHSKAEHGKHEEEHEDEAHADFHVAYRFDCGQPSRLDRITVKFFDAFPSTDELEVQLLSDKGQKAVELTAANPHLYF